VLQECEFADPSKARLPRQWYQRQVGVRMAMLGGRGTTVYTAPTPRPLGRFRGKKKGWQTKELPSEVGGVTLLVSRKEPSTTFAALHEPFEGGKRRITEFRTIQQTDKGIAVAIEGEGIDDRALLAHWPASDQPVTLAGGGERFTFDTYAFIRVGRDKVEAAGLLHAMELGVEGRPTLFLNGKEEKATIEGGLLIFRK
jgi:hypothetical protein